MFIISSTFTNILPISKTLKGAINQQFSHSHLRLNQQWSYSFPSARSAKVSNFKILKNMLGKGGKVTRPIVVLWDEKKSNDLFYTNENLMNIEIWKGEGKR